jgi:Protein of unknown function (DUF3108)
MVTMFALLLALGTQPCLPAELGKIDPPSAIQVQGAPASVPVTAPPPPPPKAVVRPPALALEERAQYRINFGVLGQLGELNINLTPALQGNLVQLLGRVKASVFGIGETEKRIVSEFDPTSLGARRWTSLRLSSGKSVTDFARQTSPGTVALVRRRPGRADQPDTLVRKAPVMDALTFILRMRLEPPRSPQTYEVLDGHGLWLLTISPARPVKGDFGKALQLDGRAQPIYWDGSADKERPTRSFSVWLSDDQFHIPLRLVMPLSVGEVRADLVTVTRNHPLAGQKALAANPMLPRSVRRHLGKGWPTGERPQ